MVKVYTTNIFKLPDPLVVPQIMDKLDEVRKEKILRHKQMKNRKQSLGAGLLLRHVLECHGILTADESMNGKIRIGIHGKPETDGLCFNLSHSEDLVVCAVSDKPIGCDIEKIEKAPWKVAERFFAESEKKYLNGFSGDERNQEFYRLWTMKESYIKMTGEGMSLPLGHFELRMNDGIRVHRDGEIEDCFLKEYEVLGYVLTACAKENNFAKKGIDISFL